MKTVEEEFAAIDAMLRESSVAEPQRPGKTERLTSGYGGTAYGLPGEKYPSHQGEEMFCLFQIVISELPFRPPALAKTELLVLFLNRREIPEGKEGWELREYTSLEGLVPLVPNSSGPKMVEDVPVDWGHKMDDAPGWSDAQLTLNLEALVDDDEASDDFFERYNRYYQTKVGGFAYQVQGPQTRDEFVFQIGTEEKAQWMWGDNGIAYFFKETDGTWWFSWDCY